MPTLSHTIYEALVLLLTKKRLGHRGLALDSLCNILDRIQPNQIAALSNNGEGIISTIRENLQTKLESVAKEAEAEIHTTVQSLSEKGIYSNNIYLYMQGHSIYNLICRIGKAIMNESFEQQVLLPSFSVDNDYQELKLIKDDIQNVL